MRFFTFGSRVTNACEGHNLQQHWSTSKFPWQRASIFVLPAANAKLMHDALVGLVEALVHTSELSPS